MPQRIITPKSRSRAWPTHQAQIAPVPRKFHLAACTSTSPCLFRISTRLRASCAHPLSLPPRLLNRISRAHEAAAHFLPSCRINCFGMEALLSLAFDNIASKDTQKIRKGLRQIEGMLAQICLSSGKATPSKPGHRRNQSAINLGEQPQSTPKKLGQLSEDPAFREFFRLQEGFEWNGECTKA